MKSVKVFVILQVEIDIQRSVVWKMLPPIQFLIFKFTVFILYSQIKFYILEVYTSCIQILQIEGNWNLK
jgi:hypothetical protein